LIQHSHKETSTIQEAKAEIRQHQDDDHCGGEGGGSDDCCAV